MAGDKVKIPSRDTIMQYLKEAKQHNKGPWDIHSLHVAEGARRIAERLEDMDEELAYAMGALHDIGRREGFSYMHHTITGYKFLLEEGYEDIARACLTHSFCLQDVNEYVGENDCSLEEYKFIKNYLGSITYNDYDRLIQLCDTFALPEGFVFMEKRMIDIISRYGTNDYTQAKVQKMFEIKDYFEKKMGCSLYDALPEVKKNTFG